MNYFDWSSKDKTLIEMCELSPNVNTTVYQYTSDVGTQLYSYPNMSINTFNGSTCFPGWSFLYPYYFWQKAYPPMDVINAIIGIQ